MEIKSKERQSVENTGERSYFKAYSGKEERNVKDLPNMDKITPRKKKSHPEWVTKKKTETNQQISTWYYCSKERI